MRQESLEKVNDDLRAEPFSGVPRVPTPPGQGWSPAGSESCVVRGRPRLRSVDSERAGHAIEPRDKSPASADGVSLPEGNTEPSHRPEGRARRGQRARHARSGLPRNLGDLDLSTRTNGSGPGKTPRRQDASIAPASTVDAGVVPTPEGNEGRSGRRPRSRSEP